MGDGPLIIQRDNVDDIPQAGREMPPWTTAQRRPRLDWRVVAVLCVFVLIALLLISWLFGHDIRAWLSYGWGAQIVFFTAWGIPIMAGLFLARRLLLVEQPGGFKVPLWQLDARPVIGGVLDVQRSYAATPFRQVAAYTLTNPQATAQIAAPEVIDVLPAAPDIGPLPAGAWLDWLDRQPHALFAAKTGGGKSTIAKVGLKPRIAGGEQVFVIDPHSNGWFALPGVAGGENWDEAEEAMLAVVSLYRERLAERETYKRETGRELDQYHFPRLTVVFDEVNNAKEAFDKLYAGSRKRANPWPLFTQILGSGARKVGVSIWLLAQSALVEDLGLSGAMRQNFTRFALDEYTIRQMTDREERVHARKQAIYAALPGMPFPAAAMVESEVWLLDRAGLDHISPPAHSERAAWDGWDYAGRRPSGLRMAPVEPQIPAQYVSPESQIAYLAKTTRMGTREIRAALNCDYNLVVKICGIVRNGVSHAVRQRT